MTKIKKVATCAMYIAGIISVIWLLASYTDILMHSWNEPEFVGNWNFLKVVVDLARN